MIASPQLRSELGLVLRGRRSRTSSMAGIGRNRNGGFGAERAESCRSLKFFNRGKQSRPATCYRAGYWGLGAALARESLVERERPGQIARSGSVEVQNGRRQSRVAPFRRNAVIGCPRYRWIGPSHFILGCDHQEQTLGKDLVLPIFARGSAAQCDISPIDIGPTSLELS